MDKKKSGFTLIEMLVGIVIGMIVVAAASVMMVTVLKSQKDITASARLNQELGAAMAVMSNEIRRAGFSVCDIKKMDDAGLTCPDFGKGEVPYILYNTSDPSDPSNPLPFNKDLEILDVDGGNDDGDCILYRYNADVDRYGYDATDTDAEVDYLSEHRGFRLVVSGGIGVIQIAQSDNTSVKCNENNRWVPFTNPDVINVTGLIFSTAGSKCRNMTLPDPNPDPAVIAQYWVVKDKTAPAIQTGSACESGTTPVDFYVAIDDPTDPLETFTGKTVPFTGIKVNTIPVDLKNGDQIFGTRQIKITLEATLKRDPAVTKRLETSVKVANPRVHCWPYTDHAECSPP